MSEFKNYIKTALQPMRPYVPGESMNNIAVNDEDTPEAGGMVAMNPANHRDQWYVGKDFYRANYKLCE